MSLKVQVAQARNLKARDKAVPPEVYCLLIFEKQKEKTAVSSATTLPFWDESFTFPVTSPTHTSVFEIEVYDKDLFGSEFLGKVTIPLYEAMGQGRWYELKDRGKKETRVGGEIRLIVGTVGLSDLQRAALLTGGKKESTGTGTAAGTGGGQKGYSKWDDNEAVPEKERETRANIVEAEELAKGQKEATRRMLGKLNDTQTVGVTTLTTLQEQGDQLKRIQKGVDRVNDNTDEANDNIKQVDSFWYAVKTHFKKKKKKTRDTNAKLDDKIGRSHAIVDDGKSPRNHEDEHLPSNHNKRHIENNGLASHHPKELGILSKDAQNDIREADQNLDQMAGALKNLKQLAIQIGDETDTHNQRLDEIGRGVDYANVNVKAGTKKIDKILH